MQEGPYWRIVTGPIATVIIQLLEIGWAPTEPERCYQPDPDYNEGGIWTWEKECSEAEVLEGIIVDSIRVNWKQASEFRLGRGVEGGVENVYY
mgnify:CR=1 FL=1